MYTSSLQISSDVKSSSSLVVDVEMNASEIFQKIGPHKALISKVAMLWKRGLDSPKEVVKYELIPFWRQFGLSLAAYSLCPILFNLVRQQTVKERCTKY